MSRINDRERMSANSRKKHRRKRKSRSNRGLIVIVCLLTLALITLLSVYVIYPAVKGGKPSNFFDPRARSGTLPGKTQEEIQAELNKIVEEGMFNISIASVVTVKAGTTEALARIENIPANHHNMTVSITLEESNEVIYESAGLAPGQYIEYARLNRKLAPGEYQALALFTAYDTDDLSKAGQAAAKITIVVVA